MTTADRVHAKNVNEKKWLAVDCGPTLRQTGNETIASIDGHTVSAPNDLTITGLAANGAEICEPGEVPIPIARGIELHVGKGGTAGTLYTINVEFTTDGGQTLHATFDLQVNADP